MFRSGFIIILLCLSCKPKAIHVGKAPEQRAAYEILNQTDSSVHYFIYLPRFDSAGHLYDTLISLPSQNFRHVFLSFQSGGDKTDLLISESRELTIHGYDFLDKPECGHYWAPLFGRVSFDKKDERTFRLTGCRLKKKGQKYIHYISSGNYGYYRLLIH